MVRTATMGELDIKDEVRSLAGNRCSNCGLTDEKHRSRYGVRLHVHRVVPGSEYTIEGCVCLCYQCHAKAHAEGRRKPPTGLLCVDLRVDLHARFMAEIQRQRRTRRAVVEDMVVKYLDLPNNPATESK